MFEKRFHFKLANLLSCSFIDRSKHITLFLSIGRESLLLLHLGPRTWLVRQTVSERFQCCSCDEYQTHHRKRFTAFSLIIVKTNPVNISQSLKLLHIVVVTLFFSFRYRSMLPIPRRNSINKRIFLCQVADRDRNLERKTTV